MSDEPEPPANLLGYILNELIEIKVSAASLAATVETQSQMIDALLVALPVEERLAVLALLHAQQQALESNQEASAAAMLQARLHYWDGLLGKGASRSIGEVAAAVGLGNALVQSVPAAHAQAMRTWLAIASEGEILQDAAQLPPARLAELLRLQAASKPARLCGDASDKKDLPGAV